MCPLKFKHLILGILIIFLIGFSVNCELFDSLFPKPPDDENGEEECEYPLEPPIGNVGDTIRSCHFEVTLNSAEYIDIEYRGPRVVVHATIKFMKGNSANIFTDCFSIRDSEGNEYKWDGLGDDNQIPQVTLSEGQTIEVSTTIQVGKDSSGFTAIFQESTSRTGERNWADILKWELGF